ncbi:MAG TPA: peptidase S8 and S53 subtilisin kexin sedolisin, partial [Armatimonadota bacterium]|nr:peptidase S8 and S53 subtilisin kexin sedolisin [Armatimonadota bacterium]
MIIGLRVPFAPEGRLGASETAQQRADIAGRRSAVLNRLSDAGPRNARSFDALPFVAMQVTAADLDALTADPNVVSVAED